MLVPESITGYVILFPADVVCKLPHPILIVDVLFIEFVLGSRWPPEHSLPRGFAVVPL